MADTSISNTPTSLLNLTAQIVSAHVAGNTVATEALPGLIQSVHNALTSAGKEPVQAERPQPAVPIKKSITHDYLVCLEDGAKMKMLKRYLAKRFNLTPAQYRERWGLGSDYPMVAPGYAERRSELAKEIGLGRKAKSPVTPPKVAARKPGRPKGSGRSKTDESQASGA